MSIEWEKSAALNGCSVEALKARFERFPSSMKRIIAVCDNPECNKERDLRFMDYHEFCRSCVLINRYKNPEERVKTSENIKKAYKLDKTLGKKVSDGLIKAHLEDPTISLRQSEGSKKARLEDPTIVQRQSTTIKKRYRDDPTASKRHSADLQHQDYDKGEWTGYTDKSRSYLIPCHACIQLNSKFKGCDQHHIMLGVVINIPADLHRSINHRFPRDGREGKNMEEINELAYNYLMGDI